VDIFLRATLYSFKTSDNLLNSLGLATYVRVTFLLVTDKNARHKITAQIAIEAITINIESPGHVLRPAYLESFE
jgi:hypothetical protein